MNFNKKIIDVTNKAFTNMYAYSNRFCKRWNDRNCVLISGVPRGGTTWLAEIIGNDTKTILIWEPLRPFRLYEQGLTDFSNQLGWFPFLPVQNNWKEGSQRITNIFSLSLLNYKSLLRFNPYRKILNSNFAVIKCVTANLLLPYINKNIDMRTILLVRHPCSVVSSQMKHMSFEVAHNEAVKFFDPQFIHSIYFDRFRKVFNELHSREEMLSFIWCVQNIIPFEAPKSDLQLVVFYEELLLETENELGKIYSFIGKTMPENLDFVQKPSKTNVDFKHNKREQLGKWRETLTQKQISDILDVVDKMGIDIYTDDILPNTKSDWYRL
ncbi:MAG: sulfotransferase domain-containing protein [Bacteroidales bacterium]|jgi:hypothetical protein|nr:sulfotransferase domain-containing protein [Bacteroidales bacterium]